MIKGVSREEEQIIQNILAAYKNDYEFYYYGSRVKDNFEKTSDLDILIKSNIPYEKLMLNYKTLLDKNKPYFIICSKGTKSRKAVSVLEFYGYDVTQMSYEWLVL